MAGTKVSVLTAGAALGGTEAIPAVQSAATVKITAAQIKTFTSASPTLVTPVLGVATGTSLALGGATIGSNALAVTGSAAFSGGDVTIGAGEGISSRKIVGGYSSANFLNLNNPTVHLSSGAVGWPLKLSSGGSIWLDATSISVGTGTQDLFFSRGAAATFQHGAADAASPVAQTIKFQDVVAGTTNTAGVNATIQLPAGTGTGNGGQLAFQFAPSGSSGTAKNAWGTVFSVTETGAQVATNGYFSFASRGGIQASADAAFVFRNAANSQSFTITAGASNLATFNGQVNANGFNAGSGNIANSSGYIGTIGNFFFKGSADGVVELTGAGLTGSGFGRLQLGGTTSSFPAIKRSTTSLQARLADDSAFTNIQGKLTTDTAYTAGDPTTTGYLLVYDSTGTAYRVPALAN